MRPRLPLSAALLIAVLAHAARAAAPGKSSVVTEEADGPRVTSGFLDVKFSREHPALLYLAVDSLGAHARTTRYQIARRDLRDQRSARPSKGCPAE